MLRFHRGVVPRLRASNLLRPSVDGAIVGAHHGLASGRTQGDLNGFDPAFGVDGPGTALLGHAIEGAVAEGRGAFNALRGREPHEYAWGAVDRWNVLRIVRSAPASG